MSNLRDFLVLLAVIGEAAGIVCAVHALLHKTRTPSATLAWILFCIALPVLGAFAYLTIGQDRLLRKNTYRVRLARARHRATRTSGERISRFAIDAGPHGSSSAALTLQQLQRESPCEGNLIDIYVGGDRAYAAILDAIGDAKRSVLVQFYIFDDDIAGRELRDALVKRAGEGTKVRVLYDAVGSNTASSRFWESLRAAGITVAPFMPLRLFQRRSKINLRNHRKLIVVDEQVAFTGSMNMSARHLEGAGCTSRDILVKVRGPAVARLVNSFESDWFFATEEALDLHEKPNAVGDLGHRVHVLLSGPDDPRAVFREALLSALYQAKTSVTLATPYFVPDPSVQDALSLAARRGVHIRLLTPAHPDSVLVRLASQEHLDRLNHEGVEIFRARDPMLHMKLVVVDSELALIGSSNLDYRSFFLNFELDLAVLGTDFAARILEILDAEVLRSRRIHYLSGAVTPIWTRVATRFASLFSPIL